jgi:predicted DCC family thiol-disulfide oxidoreductase YuxK
MPTSASVSESDGPCAASPGLLPVIFFDGVCGLCNHWIDFVLARDRNRLFHFAPLQGETARDWLQLAPDESLSSVVLLDAQGIHRKTDAVWRMLVQLGGVWRIAGWLLRLVPRPVRNWGYDFIARHRYRWFGKKETCRLPTPDERARFLP